MTADPINVIEYESMVFERHLSSLPGRTRRSGGVLDQSAYTLLNLLQAGGPQSIGELSAVTGLDASTLNRQTAALLRDDLAERIADPDGGLARKFRATAHGELSAQEERAASRAGLGRLMEDWASEDREAFAELLGRFNRSIEERTGRDWPRPTASD
ncbi:MarR family winged helix-turn-helix transcriptional regulator [Microbacterium sp. A93]|uniref:MarR family winged helix-turn-helix transcriptional regulator n=1 Tax=Microbacterium sp. A93 TaxID=3450716 RepID=UPI003F4449F0